MLGEAHPLPLKAVRDTFPYRAAIRNEAQEIWKPPITASPPSIALRPHFNVISFSPVKRKATSTRPPSFTARALVLH